MDDLAQLAADHEPSVETIELLCDRLADLGVAIDPDTARDLIRTILAAEAPKLDVRWRGALRASLDTIRIAAQAAAGMLNTTAGPRPAPRSSEARRAAQAAAAPAPAAQAPASQAPAVQVPATPPMPAAPPASAAPAPTRTPTPSPDHRRPIARRGPRRPSREEPAPPPADTSQRHHAEPDDDANERRPVFKRPRGR